MKLNEINKLSEQLAESLKSINELIEEKEVAYSNITYWSTHEDLFGNLEQAMMRIPTIDNEIIIITNQIKEIINQLCIIQNQ